MDEIRQENEITTFKRMIRQNYHKNKRLLIRLIYGSKKNPEEASILTILLHQSSQNEITKVA